MPSYEGIEVWEDSLAQEFRFVSGDLDHGENLLRKAFIAVKRNRDADDSVEFGATFAGLASDCAPYALALEKLSASLVEKLQVELKCRWQLLRQKR